MSLLIAGSIATDHLMTFQGKFADSLVVDQLDKLSSSFLVEDIECRQRGYRFIADPSQQLAFGEGELIRQLIAGATILFSNEYESHLIESKTGWSPEDILDRVDTQVITLGKDGVRIVSKGEATIE